MGVPHNFGVVQTVYATGLYDLTTHAGPAAFVEAAVGARHAHDPRWGHLRKQPAQTNIHGHAEDSALYLSDTPGQSWAVDFIVDAGDPAARPGWQPDPAPYYSRSDWFSPVDHDVQPPVPPSPALPPYPGDVVFDEIGVALFADYALAGQPPNPQMGRWFGRTVYDYLAGMPLDASVTKHRGEWRSVLGLPPLS